VGLRAVDRGRERLQQLTRMRCETGELLANLTECLQHDASLRVRLQQELLRCAITRRGLRALRATQRCKRALRTSSSSIATTVLQLSRRGHYVN